MKRRIYIFQQPLSSELPLLFESISEDIHIERQEDNLIVLLDEDFYNEEPLDLEEFYMLLIDDFDRNVTIVIEPYLEENFPLASETEAFIKTLPAGVFYFEDVITYAVLKNNDTMKQAIKEYIKKRSSIEVLHTVREFIENNMNSSVSAKKLYMHRNTLNYRIENFISATHINVKTFKGANAIYMLYKF